MADPPEECRILALYRFVSLSSPDEVPFGANDGGDGRPDHPPALRALRTELLATLRRHGARGTLLLAPEGINGTICYPSPPPPASSRVGNDGAEQEEEEEEGDGSSDDPVARYLTTHPLFGGPELRTRASVWRDGESGGGGGEGGKPRRAFHRLKVKIKSEIVTLGLGRPLVDRRPVMTAERASLNGTLSNPLAARGTYLTPAQWDEACRDPDVLVIDARNSYEVEIGTFEGAVDPQTENFSDFPDYLRRLSEEYDWDCNNDDSSRGASLGNNGIVNGNPNEGCSDSKNDDGDEKKKPPPKGIAMFCTGGIRCEKATSYALRSGLFPRDLPVYHLEGGILAYLDDVAERESNGDDGGGKRSAFRGECFVFDRRVAVGAGLAPSTKYVSCHGCRGPMDRGLLEPDNGSDDDNDTNGGDNHDDDGSSNSNGKNATSEGPSPGLPTPRRDPTTGLPYLPGLTCPRCHGSASEASLRRFAQRERQNEMCARDGKSLFRDLGGMKDRWWCE